MADTFTQAFIQAFNSANKQEEAQRLQTAQMMQMLQITKMAQEMSQDAYLRQKLGERGELVPGQEIATNTTQQGGYRDAGAGTPDVITRTKTPDTHKPTGFQQSFGAGFTQPEAAIELGRQGFPLEKIKSVIPQVSQDKFGTLENILAAKVRAGEITLADALALKNEQKQPNEVSAIREFETVTGIDPKMRGTPEYRNAYLRFMESKKEASPYPDIARQQADLQRQMKGAELRKEFGQRAETKYFKEISPRFATLEKALEASRTSENKVAIDQAIINMYNKMMDPESVVRESEYARTTEDLSVWNRLKGKIEKWKGGGPGLTQDDREAMYKMAKEFKNVAEEKYQATHGEYTGYVKQIGLDPNIYMEPMKGTKSSRAGKPLSKAEAAAYLRQAGGDKEKARALAKQDGRTF